MILGHSKASISVLRLLDLLPEHPMMTLSLATTLLSANKVTALRLIQILEEAGIIHENTRRARDQVYAYRRYLAVLSEDMEAVDA